MGNSAWRFDSRQNGIRARTLTFIAVFYVANGLRIRLGHAEAPNHPLSRSANARAPTQQTTVDNVDNVDTILTIATKTSFTQFAQAWPHSRKQLQLAFVNPKHQAIHTAQTHANPALCSDVILRVQTQTPGHLVLFVQDDAGTCFQCYPNTPEQASSAAGHSPSPLN